MPEYLKLRNGRYYVRVPVPKHLWNVVGKRDIVRTTGTGDLKEARKRRFAIAAEIHQEIEAAVDANPASLIWFDQQAAALRKSVQRGELDAQLASDIIGNLRDQHLKARGQSPEGELSAAQMSRLRSATRFASDSNFIPLSKLIERYIEEKRPILQPSTVSAKERALNEFSEWAGKDIDINDVTRKVTGAYVSDILVGNGKHPKTNQDTITQLSTFFNYAFRRGIYENASPWTGLGQTVTGSKRGSSKQKERRWTDKELKQLFKTVPSGPKYYLREMAAIAAYTGMRQNEIAELEVADIDLKTKTIHVSEGKTESSVRTLPIHSKLLPVVKQLIGRRTNAYLFETFKPTGKDKKRGHEFSKRFGYWRNQNFPDTLYEINNQGHKRSVVNFHSFRRAFANALELAEVPHHTAQQLLGHTRDSMTYGTYSKGVDMKLLREAIEKVDFKGVKLASRVHTIVGNL